jgi:hypothetical protein
MNAPPRYRVRPNGMKAIKVCHVAHLPKLLAFERRTSMAFLHTLASDSNPFEANRARGLR